MKPIITWLVFIWHALKFILMIKTCMVKLLKLSKFNIVAILLSTIHIILILHYNLIDLVYSNLKPIANLQLTI